MRTATWLLAGVTLVLTAASTPARAASYTHALRSLDQELHRQLDGYEGRDDLDKAERKRFKTILRCLRKIRRADEGDLRSDVETARAVAKKLARRFEGDGLMARRLFNVLAILLPAVNMAIGDLDQRLEEDEDDLPRKKWSRAMNGLRKAENAVQQAREAARLINNEMPTGIFKAVEAPKPVAFYYNKIAFGFMHLDRAVGDARRARKLVARNAPPGGSPCPLPELDGDDGGGFRYLSPDPSGDPILEVEATHGSAEVVDTPTGRELRVRFGACRPGEQPFFVALRVHMGTGDDDVVVYEADGTPDADALILVSGGGVPPDQGRTTTGTITVTRDDPGDDVRIAAYLDVSGDGQLSPIDALLFISIPDTVPPSAGG